MNKPRECRCARYVIDGRDEPVSVEPVANPDCNACAGTGKVWPSVEGERVIIIRGPDSGDCASGVFHLLPVIDSAETCRVIVQPVREEP